MRALGCGSRRKMLIAVTLFPHPDSPTKAKNSPSWISKETRSVTCKGFTPSRGLPFLSKPNATERLLTHKTGFIVPGTP